MLEPYTVNERKIMYAYVWIKIYKPYGILR
jgi:hypothetical protein